MNGNIKILYHYYDSYFEQNITQLLYISSNKIKYNKYEKNHLLTYYRTVSLT